MVLMVLEVILVFLGVVLVVPPQSTDPSSTDPTTVLKPLSVPIISSRGGRDLRLTLGDLLGTSWGPPRDFLVTSKGPPTGLHILAVWAVP